MKIARKLSEKIAENDTELVYEFVLNEMNFISNLLYLSTRIYTFIMNFKVKNGTSENL